MASVVLRGIGGVVGGMMGGPIGASIGAGIGGMIGDSVDAKMAKPLRYSVSGHRMQDLKVQTSAYGKIIPIAYGKSKLAGNVIWALPIKERKHQSETHHGGGKGQRKSVVVNTEYTYSVTLAIALCKGEIDSIINIWADAKIITSEIKNIQIYKGSESQMPDPLIESVKGVGNVPAYRGMAYVVIEDFPLGNYGNRVPNFSFEVERNPKNNALASEQEPSVEEMVESICIIPGSGEFVYDTQIQNKISTNVSGQQAGKSSHINMNNLYGKADSLVSLDQLQRVCPNMKWTAPVVTWFGDNLDAKQCIIKPGVEFKDNASTSPDVWKVGEFDRKTAHQITLKDNRPIYGGSVSDASVIRYLAELRDRRYKIMFYPMLFMGREDKPWRGHISCKPEDVDQFFTRKYGYNEFILHYANLVKGKVDAFVIGSELKKLTSIMSSINSNSNKNNHFPAVNCLVDLAHKVKNILGEEVKIIYAADWSEYHHSDGGWYNLDKLWSCSSIDVIGIDAYFPLTENSGKYLSESDVISGWSSGEGYNYYYDDANGGRKRKHNLVKKYAWKDIKWWWENEHINPDGTRTEWVPKSKKIWFTEYGFPSVDGASNQPNVFYDPECLDGGLPRHSRGITDFNAQRRAISATIKHWRSSDMVENMFLWTWDARPYPFWPALKECWSDGYKWSKGHWVNGKFGITKLSDVIIELCKLANLNLECIDVSSINEFIDGYVINSIISSREVIENLASLYFFDIAESEGKIKFISRLHGASYTIDKRDLIYQSGNGNLVNITRAQEQNLPSKIEILYFDKLNYYQQSIVRVENANTISSSNVVLDPGLVMDYPMAENMASTMLNNIWCARSSFEFLLPFKYAHIEPGDMIVLGKNNIRVSKVSLIKNRILKIVGISDDTSIYDYRYDPEIGFDIPEKEPIQNYVSHILDIPPRFGEVKGKSLLYLAVANDAGKFKPASIYFSEKSQSNDDLSIEDKFIDVVISESTIGEVEAKLDAANPDIVDVKSKITVTLTSGLLSSITFDGMIKGKNLCMIGNELVQFMQAKLISPNIYELSTLLRGRMGTEHCVGLHQENERFILIDSNLKPIEVPHHMMNIPCEYKIVADGEVVESSNAKDFKWEANSIKPFSPVHIDYDYNKVKNELEITWLRRARFNGLWNDRVDVPLDESCEQYEVDILLKNQVVDTLIVDESNIKINLSKYPAFDSMKDDLELKLHQCSSLIGRGNASIQKIHL